MFDVAPTELLLLGIVALVVIGPKDLPRAMRFVGKWVARARGMARHFRDGMDEMIRQSELEDMEKKWREENERIMREHPAPSPMPDPAHPVLIDQPPAALPAPDPEAVADAAERHPPLLPTPGTPHPAPREAETERTPLPTPDTPHPAPAAAPAAEDMRP